MIRYFFLSIGLIFLSCQPTKQEVDLLVINANVYTVDEKFNTVEAFAIKEGKFVAAGTTKEITDRFTAAEVVNADGKAITPGLIDAHCHFYRLGLDQQTVDLVGTKSYQEVLERVQAFQKKNPSNFIIGRGWDQNDWEVKEFPNKKELDELFPDTPVSLSRIDGHALLVNSAALKLAGINNNTKVDGGEIVKYGNEITGVLIDNPMTLIDSITPAPNLQTRIKALKDAEAICLSYGLTTVNDAGIDRSTIELIDSLQQIGELSIRMYAMISNNPKEVDYFLEKGPVKTEKLNVRSVKVYGDGALGSRGAALKEPYSDKHQHFGAMVTPVNEIADLAKKLSVTEFQMNTHAIGDSANAVVLRAYKNALEGKTNKRWKVEHAQVIDEEDFDYFEKGIIPSVQPTHATSDMYWAEDRLGEKRIQGAYAYKSLLNKAGMVALGTDFPVEQVSPFLTFYAAVARQDLEQFPEGGFQNENALSRKEALRGMTIWAAYSNFEENEKGSIEPGKMADFVIYEKDMMQVPLTEIPKTKVLATYIGGVKM
ncbi:amidohydrolase [Cytophaga sp. FL35]|uniref:amidohydrolase n=1 Tax=Cytophaga sp. FL35 TaxID=1904456 RepID=UPI001653D3FE|nr:amidohydrolase [Cytophaga sp. FL35]MBC6998174.1 amidohydrolase [Cytophaga sp. FL35]